MNRRKKNDKQTSHERWLVSYADFITLLFAFFVVLFSASQVDKRKVGKLAVAIQTAFQELGIFPASNTRLPLSTTEPMPLHNAQIIENATRTAALGRHVPSRQGERTNAPVVANLMQIQRELEEALRPEITRHEVALKAKREGLIISLREVGFFDSGVATVRREAEPTIARLAGVLVHRPHHVRIEGHTDNVPIHTPRFASNWELSTARATGMVALLITRFGFEPQRLSAAGYAEYHPVATNSTHEGRALNRRVDIVILDPGEGLPHVTPNQIPPGGGR